MYHVTIGLGLEKLQAWITGDKGLTVQELFEWVRTLSKGGIKGDSFKTQIDGRKVPGNRRRTTVVKPGQNVWFIPGKNATWNMTHIHEVFA